MQMQLCGLQLLHITIRCLQEALLQLIKQLSASSDILVSPTRLDGKLVDMYLAAQFLLP
jgi:hypothetical protein